MSRKVGALAVKRKRCATGSAARSPTGNPTSKPPSQQNGALVVSRRYLEAWASAQYDEMYALLASGAQSRVGEERFSQRYRAITEGAGITAVLPAVDTLDVQPRDLTAGGASVQVPFTIAMRAATLGEFSERNVMPLVLQDG